MGFFSKVWKGIKKTVKKVARGVKKVAKKVVTALPGGEKLWEFGTKIGKGIQRGLGKIAGKLGPIGTMALSFVLAPVMGPAISSLWSGFGAGAAAMAGSANAIVAGLGTAGTAVFNGVNFVSGTLGSLGKALSEGVKNIGKGNFGAAGDAFMSNMKQAFSGEAGMSAVKAGTNAASRINAAKSGVNVDLIDDLTSPEAIFNNNKPVVPEGSYEFEIGMRDSKGNLFNPTADDLTGVTVPEVSSDPLISVGSDGSIGTAPVLPENAVALPENPLDVGVSPTGQIEAAGKPIEQPGILEKATDAITEAAQATRAGGESSGFETSGQDVGRVRTDVRAPGQAEAIQAAGSGGPSLWDQIIANAGRQTRGGFA